MVEQTQMRMTAGEFLELPETNQPTELIEGECIVSPSPVPKHQLASGEFYALLKTLIPGGRLFYAPIDVYFDAANVVQPDIIWVAENSRCVIGEKRLEGAPDLIVEILSPGTARRDKKEKFRLYERFGVGEYWLVEVDAQYVEVYRWQNGKFDRQGIYGPGDTFESAALGGKTVDLSAVFKEV